LLVISNISNRLFVNFQLKVEFERNATKIFIAVIPALYTIKKNHEFTTKENFALRKEASPPPATLASSTRRTIIVNNMFPASQSVDNSWPQRLPHRARFITDVAWRRSNRRPY